MLKIQDLDEGVSCIVSETGVFPASGTGELPSLSSTVRSAERLEFRKKTCLWFSPQMWNSKELRVLHWKTMTVLSIPIVLSVEDKPAGKPILWTHFLIHPGIISVTALLRMKHGRFSLRKPIIGCRSISISVESNTLFCI